MSVTFKKLVRFFSLFPFSCVLLFNFVSIFYFFNFFVQKSWKSKYRQISKEDSKNALKPPKKEILFAMNVKYKTFKCILLYEKYVFSDFSKESRNLYRALRSCFNFYLFFTKISKEGVDIRKNKWKGEKRRKLLGVCATFVFQPEKRENILFFCFCFSF